MGRPDGAHTHGHSGGGGVALVIVALVLIAAAAKPVESAARTAGHVLAVALEVALITVISAAAVAVAAVLGWAGVRVYRWRAARRAQAVPVVIRAHAEVIEDGQLPAIEAPKPRLTGVPGMYEEVTDDAR